MQHVEDSVEDSIDAVLEEVLRGAAEEKRLVPASPSVPQGRLSRFFGSLAASMALQRGKSQNPHGRQPALAPIDMVLQQYPHLSIHLMCG